jgi:hypothetical protein
MNPWGYLNFKKKLLNSTTPIPSSPIELKQIMDEEPNWLLANNAERGRIVMKLLTMGSNCPFRQPATKKGEIQGIMDDNAYILQKRCNQVVITNIPMATFLDKQRLTSEILFIANELAETHQSFISPDDILLATNSNLEAHDFTGDSFTVVIPIDPILIAHTFFCIKSKRKTSIQTNSKVVSYHHTYGITFMSDLDITLASLLLVIRGSTDEDYAFIGDQIKHALLSAVNGKAIEVLAHPVHFRWHQPNGYTESTMSCFIVILKTDIETSALHELHRILNIHQNSRGLLLLGDRRLEMATDFSTLQNSPLHPQVRLTQRALRVIGCTNLTPDILKSAIPENKHQYIDHIVILANGCAYILLKHSAPINFKSFSVEPLSDHARQDSAPMVASYQFGFTDHPNMRTNPFKIDETIQLNSKSSSPANLSKNPHDFEVVSKKKNSSK